MKKSTIIANLVVRSVIGACIGYAVGTAIDTIRTRLEQKRRDAWARRVASELPEEEDDGFEIIETEPSKNWAVVDSTGSHKAYMVGDYDTCCEYADKLNFERDEYAPDSDVEFGVEPASL